MNNAEYLKEVCIAYIQTIDEGISSDYNRGMIHNLLIKHSKLPKNELKDILHNLDCNISYPINKIGKHTENEIKKYGIRLFELLRYCMYFQVEKLLKSDEDTIAFLKEQNLTIYDFLTKWFDTLEFDSNIPCLKKFQNKFQNKKVLQ